LRNCKTPEAKFNIRIGPRVVSCKVDIPFDLDLSRDEAIDLENKVHDALENVLQDYWIYEEEFELNFDETFEELLERRLQEKKSR